jgi:hypothetical protein
MADDRDPTDPRDPVADGRDLIAELFPQVRWAILAGSVITAARTAGSDLDIVVLLGAADSRAPYRESRRFRGWPVELFVHDEQTLAHYLAEELAVRKPTLHRMVADSVALVGDPSRRQARCGVVLSSGPTPLTPAERELGRYGLTDLIDDLVHASDPGEKSVIAATLWTSVARQVLEFAGHWPGNGKWLLRELRALDHDFAARWLAAQGDSAAIETMAREVLDQRMGGPLFEGFHAVGERPR